MRERERERERDRVKPRPVLTQTCLVLVSPRRDSPLFPLRATPFILGRVRENLDARPTEIPPRNAADYFAGDICQNT